MDRIIIDITDLNRTAIVGDPNDADKYDDMHFSMNSSEARALLAMSEGRILTVENCTHIALVPGEVLFIDGENVWFASTADAGWSDSIRETLDL